MNEKLTTLTDEQRQKIQDRCLKFLEIIHYRKREELDQVGKLAEDGKFETYRNEARMVLR